MIKKLSILLIIISSHALIAQENIKWITFADLSSSMRSLPKNVLIFIHTDWCKYCLMQSQTTFKDSSIIATLNNDYYCLKLNPEDTSSIDFLGKTYQSYANEHHQLAQFLASKGGKITLPSTVLLNQKFQLINNLNIYLSANELSSILKK
jgi:thioredoxin-related protein